MDHLIQGFLGKAPLKLTFEKLKSQLIPFSQSSIQRVVVQNEWIFVHRGRVA